MSVLDSEYSFIGTLAEQPRLGRQAALLADLSKALLDRVPVAPGSTAVDVGCGPTGVLDLLSDQVGPSGQVVGLELDPDHVVLARSFARSGTIVVPVIYFLTWGRKA